MIRWLLNKSMTFVLYRPRLASGCVRVLRYFPYVNNRLILYADKEGLITPSHAPVPRSAKKGLAEVQAETGQPGSAPTEREPAGGFGLDAPVTAFPRGRNHESKSPLEKWFY